MVVVVVVIVLVVVVIVVMVVVVILVIVVVVVWRPYGTAQASLNDPLSATDVEAEVLAGAANVAVFNDLPCQSKP